MRFARAQGDAEDTQEHCNATLDAVWLAKVVEAGMCRPSLVHPKPIRQLRDLTRYRRSLVREQTREKQRLEKALEDAQIKLDSVVSSLHGLSGPSANAT